MKIITIFFLLITAAVFSQDYDNYIIDNSDYEMMQEYKVKACSAYKEEFKNDSLTTPRFLSDFYIFNERGLTVEEYNFFEADSSSKNYWYLKAQYDQNGFVVAEQWFYFDFDEIDSTIYTHDDQGRILIEEVRYYESDYLESKDSLLNKYYPDSVVQIDLITDVLTSYRVEKGDTIINYSVYSDYRHVMINMKDTDELTITYYPKDDKTIETYYEFDDSGRTLSAKSFMNKEPANEYLYTYKDGLLTRLVSINHEYSLKTITEYQYEFYE